MTARDPDSTVLRAVAALGIEGADLAPLGGGFASEAWRVGRDDPWLALRIANDRSTPDAGYQAEHALMDRLANAGARVPRPIRGSWQIEHWDGPPFSCATGLDGTPLAVEDGVRAAPILAAFLRLLHGQSLDGYGPLEVHDGRLQGAASTMVAGLMAWARRPLWPLGDARLDTHPALAERRDLRVRLDARAPAVRLALTEARGVPLHSDLHDENILDAGGALGIIDFGQALIGPAAWEFAALAYFLGWSTADATLEAYARDAAESSRLRTDATAIGLCFGVYRWAQDVELGIDEDAYDEAFLVETLNRS